MAYYAGLDLGTSSVKMLIVDDKGTVKGVGQADYPLHIPQTGWVQQEPDQWCAAAKTAVQDAIVKAGIRADEIAAISFSGQMHGLVALGDDGAPVYPAMIWMDQRSAKEQQELLEKAPHIIENKLLNKPAPGMMACSLLWIKNHEPAVFEKIRTVLLPKDYIRYCLCGEKTTDRSDASATLLFATGEGEWCKELADVCGFDPAILPTLTDSAQCIGYVSPEAAAEWGLSVTTKVVAGGGDAAMQMVGNGVVRPGVAVSNIGTASQFAVFAPAAQKDATMRCQLWNHAVPNAWYMQGGSLNGGSTLGWLRKNILQKTVTFEDLSEAAGNVPVGSEGLMFLPYLSGERTPYQDPDAKGVFFGLSMKHHYGHMARAIMEGITYNLLLCAQIMGEAGMTYDKLIAAGGGANGSVWRQIQADMFGVPVYTNAVGEEACFGACICAMVGDGLFADIPTACDTLVKTDGAPTMPIAENTAFYKEQLAKFAKLYEISSPLF